MESRSLVRLRLIAAAIAAVVLTGDVVAALDQSVPRTAWGAPDLQGVWDRRTLTPFQRPRALEGQEVFAAVQPRRAPSGAPRRRSKTRGSDADAR